MSETEQQIGDEEFLQGRKAIDIEHTSCLKKVAVIGAGAAGLAALRHLSTRLDMFEPIAFEQMSCIGGTWNYTDDVGCDENGVPIHSSMYKNLYTNLPKEVMAFPDFPFPNELLSYISHSDVLTYLQNYAVNFNLHQFIKYNHAVRCVRPITTSSGDDNQVCWELSYQDLETNRITVDVFDAVMVCSGHFHRPIVPVDLNFSSFNGLVVHSHDYREPERFRDMEVIVLGAGLSGIDISAEVSQLAKKVYLCHQKGAYPESSLPEAVIQKCVGIRELRADGAVLDNGELLVVDAVILCTGYWYSFPFLSKDSCLQVTAENVVIPLYKHLIHAHYPTMSFIGIPKKILPFPMFDCQVQFVLAQLSGKMVLPGFLAMEEEVRKRYTKYVEAGNFPRHFHDMGSLQWQYYDCLASSAGFEPLPRVLCKIYSHCTPMRLANCVTYRSHNFEIIDDNSFLEL